MQTSNVIEFVNVSKSYPMHGSSFTALDQIDLQVVSGEFLAILGRSGSGKSTLLNLIAGIDFPTSGQVIVNGSPIYQIKEEEIAKWRGKNIGIVFQFFQLLPTLTVLENVMLPMDFSNSYPSDSRRSRAIELLQRFGIEAQADKVPSSLSGGEQQRAAMARALANDPPIIVADEPTGNLDSNTAASVLDLFQDLSAAGKTIVMVTHEREIEALVHRVVHLEDGRIISGVRSHANALD